MSLGIFVAEERGLVGIGSWVLMRWVDLTIAYLVVDDGAVDCLMYERRSLSDAIKNYMSWVCWLVGTRADVETRARMETVREELKWCFVVRLNDRKDVRFVSGLR